MANFEVEVTISSAKDLNNVNSKQWELKPYVVAWVDPSTKYSTSVDEGGGTSPRWDQTLVVTSLAPIKDSTTLSLEIFHDNPAAEGDDALVGSTSLPLKGILDDVGIGMASDFRLKLKRPSGKPHGELEVRITLHQQSYGAPQQWPNPPPCWVPPQAQDYAVPHQQRKDLAYNSNTQNRSTQQRPQPQGYPLYRAPQNYHGLINKHGQQNFGGPGNGGAYLPQVGQSFGQVAHSGASPRTLVTVGLQQPVRGQPPNSMRRPSTMSTPGQQYASGSNDSRPRPSATGQGIVSAPNKVPGSYPTSQVPQYVGGQGNFKGSSNTSVVFNQNTLGSNVMARPSSMGQVTQVYRPRSGQGPMARPRTLGQAYPIPANGLGGPSPMRPMARPPSSGQTYPIQANGEGPSPMPSPSMSSSFMSRPPVTTQFYQSVGGQGPGYPYVKNGRSLVAPQAQPFNSGPYQSIGEQNVSSMMGPSAGANGVYVQHKGVQNSAFGGANYVSSGNQGDGQYGLGTGLAVGVAAGMLGALAITEVVDSVEAQDGANGDVQNNDFGSDGNDYGNYGGDDGGGYGENDYNGNDQGYDGNNDYGDGYDGDDYGDHAYGYQGNENGNGSYEVYASGGGAANIAYNGSY